jgi:Fusaric acid resistance protein family
MSVARLEVSARSNANRPDTARIVHALRSAAPALLFGLRLWTAVCLALYTAFWLQLDNAYWAGTSAAIVCQPSLGASLRKGWFRMVGTAVGAVAIMTLTACPQQRDSFLLGSQGGVEHFAGKQAAARGQNKEHFAEFASLRLMDRDA